jgi:predicted RNA-binding Zn-ribbon protein involved in translation (DUF1610 family)
LTTTCPGCGHKIEPSEIMRTSSTEMRCPKCRIVFVAGK